MRTICAVLLALTLCPAGAVQAFTISFGSCNQHDRPQVMWKSVSQNNPDVWIWTGDIIYADTQDMRLMSEKYGALKANPLYRAFANAVKVIGVWDDHDYGVSDGGKEYPQKDAAQTILLNFLDEPRESNRRKQKGVYTSYVFEEGSRQVKIILLDTRYHRDAPSDTGDILGAEQWQWLEKELKSSTAKINILVSSIQVIPEEHRWEKWSNFPKSRERLFSLIRTSKISGLLIISGDRHIAEVSKLADGALPYPLYEVTSSGMTHSWSNFPGEPNRHRVGRVFTGKNFGVIEINWNNNPEIIVKVHDQENNVVLQETIFLSQISVQ